MNNLELRMVIQLKVEYGGFQKIKIGNETIYNVEFSSISSENAPFLLGMSTLERLGNYSIVPNENLIIITK